MNWFKKIFGGKKEVRSEYPDSVKKKDHSKRVESPVISDFVSASLEVKYQEREDSRWFSDFEELPKIDSLRKMGKKQEALSLCRKGQETYPDSFLFYLRAAELCDELGISDEADRILIEGLSKSLSKCSIAGALADRALARNDYRNAIRWWIAAGYMQLESNIMVDKMPFLNLAYVCQPYMMKDTESWLFAMADRASNEGPVRFDTEGSAVLHAVARKAQEANDWAVKHAIAAFHERYTKPEDSKSQDKPVSDGHPERSGRAKRTLEDSSLIGVKFAKIPAGSFLMGSPDSEPDRNGDEVQHTVVIGRPFLMCTTPVTQKVWEKIMGSNPSGFKGDDLPVETVSWFDAVAFCNELSELEGLKPAYAIRGEDVTWDHGANGYRLPTEAEWEYACRAGTTTAYNTGDSESDLDRSGWYECNSGEKTHPVGQKEPNAWGLYDMHGNVSEWCWDWYDDYPVGKVTDPKGPSTGAARVLRGGYWSDGARSCRSAGRSDYIPDVGSDGDVGFRPVRSAF